MDTSSKRLLNHGIHLQQDRYDAVIFDMDGVVTQTAQVHAKAWKKVFDTFLQKRFSSAYQPFDNQDYLLYVDGKPRYEGVKSFLESRGIHLPWGNPNDLPEQETICALGNQKNRIFLNLIRDQGVEVYESTIHLIQVLRRTGVKTAVISASKNTPEVLKAANISELFDAKVDGHDAIRLGLKGKPEPDVFLEAAQQLGSTPKRTVVVEDAIAGVQAGKKGGFGLVIGVDRGHQDKLLKENGADIVVKDLSEVEVSDGTSIA